MTSRNKLNARLPRMTGGLWRVCPSGWFITDWADSAWGPLTLKQGLRRTLQRERAVPVWPRAFQLCLGNGLKQKNLSLSLWHHSFVWRTFASLLAFFHFDCCWQPDCCR